MSLIEVKAQKDLIDIVNQINNQKNKNDIVSVFILPPSKKELERRLMERDQDSNKVVRKRMDGASSEITHWAEYDYVIINEDLNLSVQTVLAF